MNKLIFDLVDEIVEEIIDRLGGTEIEEDNWVVGDYFIWTRSRSSISIISIGYYDKLDNPDFLGELELPERHYIYDKAYLNRIIKGFVFECLSRDEFLRKKSINYFDIVEKFNKTVRGEFKQDYYNPYYLEGSYKEIVVYFDDCFPDHISNLKSYFDFVEYLAMYDSTHLEPSEYCIKDEEEIILNYINSKFKLTLTFSRDGMFIDLLNSQTGDSYNDYKEEDTYLAYQLVEFVCADKQSSNKQYSKSKELLEVLDIKPDEYWKVYKLLLAGIK